MPVGLAVDTNQSHLSPSVCRDVRQARVGQRAALPFGPRKFRLHTRRNLLRGFNQIDAEGKKLQNGKIQNYHHDGLWAQGPKDILSIMPNTDHSWLRKPCLIMNAFEH